MNIKKTMLKGAVSAQTAMQNAITKVKEKSVAIATNNGGFSETTEKLLWALGGAVIVITVVTLVIAFINSEAFPAFKDKLSELLNL